MRRIILATLAFAMFLLINGAVPAQAPPSASTTKATGSSAAAPAGATQGVGPAQPAQADLTRITDSLATVQKGIDDLKERHWIRDVGPIVVSTLSMVVAIIALVVTARHNRRTLQEKAREEERKSIREKLDQFYGPLLQLRGVSKHLYEIFNARRQGPDDAEFRNDQGKFRTLYALINGRTFEGIDGLLIEQINQIGLQSEKLISEKVGLVDDPGLQDLLWRLATHYRVFDLAKDKKLTGGGEEFTNFSFPYQVDGQLQAKANALNARLDQLQSLR